MARTLFFFILGSMALAANTPRVTARTLPIHEMRYAIRQRPSANCNPNVVNYDIVYVRAPRRGNNENTSWPDTTRPMNPEPNTQLRLLHPDCTDELLFPRAQDAAIVDAAIANDAATDPNLSFGGSERWQNHPGHDGEQKSFANPRQR